MTDKYQIDSPIYINTRFNYFCEDCDMIEPEVKTDTIYANDVPYSTYHTLTCKKYDACKALMHNLRYILKAERKE